MTELDLSRFRGAQSASIYSGGRSLDRVIPDNDKDPLRNLLDFQDPLGAIAEAAGEVGEQIRNAIVGVIRELAGIDLSDWDAFIASLRDGKGIDLPIIVDLLDLLTPAVQMIQAALQGIDLTGDPGAVLRAILEAVGQQIVDLIRRLPQLITRVPIGALSNEEPNRFPAPGFPAGSIAPGGEWSVDMASSRTADGTGSGMVVADGRPHALRTGENADDIIPVGPGQKFPVEVWGSHQGAVATGVAVRLQLQLFAEGGVPIIGPVTLDEYTPAVADLPWPGHRLSGSYTVENGVTGVQGRIYVTENAMAGTYRFDDSRGAQASGLSALPGLEQILSSLDHKGDALLDAIASAARGFPVIGATIAEVAEALAAFNPASIGGFFGPGTLAGDFASILDNLVSGMLGRRVTGASPEDLFNAAAGVNNVAGVDEAVYVVETRAVPVPAFTNWIDAAAVGRGQDGQDGFPGFFGQGGAAGKFNATTWERDVHFDDTVTEVQVVMNSDGSVTISIPGHSLTAAAGSGPQNLQLLGNWHGRAAGELDYNGKTYLGGTVQNAWGGKGVSPGGGGAGGRGILVPEGGPGGDPAAWLRFRANTVPNQSAGADTSPPSSPTLLEVISATHSSLTLSASGSFDG